MNINTPATKSQDLGRLAVFTVLGVGAVIALATGAQVVGALLVCAVLIGRLLFGPNHS